MFLTAISLTMVLAGARFAALAYARSSAANTVADRGELIGGSLLASGLILIGAGFQCSLS